MAISTLARSVAGFGKVIEICSVNVEVCTIPIVRGILEGREIVGYEVELVGFRVQGHVIRKDHSRVVLCYKICNKQ